MSLLINSVSWLGTIFQVTQYHGSNNTTFPSPAHIQGEDVAVGSNLGGCLRNLPIIEPNKWGFFVFFFKQIKVTMNDEDMDTYVFAVGARKALVRLQKEMQDLVCQVLLTQIIRRNCVSWLWRCVQTSAGRLRLSEKFPGRWPQVSWENTLHNLAMYENALFLLTKRLAKEKKKKKKLCLFIT